MAIILGIDPGSRKLGYGLIKSEQQKLVHIDNGTLNIPLTDLSERLGYIYSHLLDIIKQFQPSSFAIEEVFVHKNVSSALKLGHARGVAILAAINSNLVVSEYAARAVKQSVVGKGSADKNQVAQMVKILLNLPEPPMPDAADALAVAICHANTSCSLLNNLKYSKGRWR